MRFIAVCFLFVCISQIYVSAQNFPPNFFQLWKDFKYTITSDDCESGDFKNTFPKCDNIFGNLKGPDFIGAVVNFIMMELRNISQTQDVINQLGLFCRAVDTYVNCITDAGKQCSNGKSWKKFINKLQKQNPVYTFTKDFCRSGQLRPEYAVLSDWNSLMTCFSDLDRQRRVMDTLMFALNSIKRCGDTLDRDRDMPDSAVNNKQIRVLCRIMADVKRTIYMSTKKCGDRGRMLLFKLTQLIMPPDIDGQCKMPKDDDSEYVQSFRSNDASRATVFIFGGCHKLLANTTTIDTCQYGDGENVTFFQLDKLSIIGTTAVLSNSYTYIKAVYLLFANDSGDNIDSLTMANCLMPTSFDINGGTVLDENSKKGKGTFNSKIVLNVVSTFKIRVMDLDVGANITVFKFQSGDKCAYSIVFRLPQAAFDSAGGGMSRECMVSADLGTRSKREATLDTSKQASYDATGFNDANAKNMASDAQSEVAFSVTYDKGSGDIKGSGLVACLLLAMYVILFI